MLEKYKKYTGWIMVAFVIILLYTGMTNYGWILGQFDKLMSILTPFFWGFAIAYILNPLMVRLEKKFKLKRGMSMLGCYIVFFGLIGMFISIVVPVVLTNLIDIINMLPEYMEAIQSFFDETILGLSVVEKLNMQEFLASNFRELGNFVLNFLNITLNTVVSQVLGITSGLLKFIIGIIISMYMLNEKESFIVNGKKFLLAIFGEAKSKRAVELGNLTNHIFSNFFVGKAIDSLIIGVLCFIGLWLLKAPYALLMSLIVGIFNMIPYFGPFIGAIPAVLVTLFISPMKAVWVILFILLLQQLDGNVIGPKILGDMVGISPFYIILSIMIGGGFFGMLGMLFAVPFFKLMSVILDQHMDQKIANQGLEFKG